MTRRTLAALVLALAPGLAVAQSATVVVTNTDPAIVDAIIRLQDMANGTSGPAAASVRQRGRNNAAGIAQSGGGRQRAQIVQSGCNNTATTSQTAAKTSYIVVQQGCNNTYHGAQNNPNTATFVWQFSG